MSSPGDPNAGGGSAAGNLWILRATIASLAAIALTLGGFALTLVGPTLANDAIGSVVTSLGSFFLVGGVWSLLYRSLFQRLDREHEQRQLRNHFDASLDRFANNVFRYGLRRIQPEMSFDHLFDDLHPGDVLWWLDTYAPSHKAWMQKLRRALLRGAHVRMLILEPTSPLGTLRAEEIGPFFTPERFHAELTDFARDMVSLARDQSCKGRMEVRFYQGLLGCPVYFVKRRGRAHIAYTSLYLSAATGTGFPHLVWEDQSEGLVNYFATYVEEKWGKAIPPPER